MSFAIPRNVPSFNHPDRRYEDALWGSSSSRASNGYGLHIPGTGGGSGKELPMYKDKPYNYPPSRRRGRRRTWLGLMILGVVFWLYYRGSFGAAGGVSEGEVRDAKSLWGSMGKGSKGRVDWDSRREQVKKAMEISWAGYEKYAWGMYADPSPIYTTPLTELTGYDEYHPVSKTGKQMVPPTGLGWIIIDALDTLMLMNMTTAVSHAREWISTTLTYDLDHDVNTFETTIRMLGGLLAAHYLQSEHPSLCPVDLRTNGGEDLYLEKASDLADRLLSAFETDTGIPWSSVNLKQLVGIRSHADGGAASLAEATSVQLEMKYIAKLTGEKTYWDKAERVMKAVDDANAADGLMPIFISPATGKFTTSNIRLGSRGDSYYEYLIKQYLQTEKTEPVYLELWDESLKGMKKHLVTYTEGSNMTIIAERPKGLDGELSPKMDHLVCFMPGTMALAATEGLTLSEARKQGKLTEKAEQDLQLAAEIMKTCMGMYRSTATGLAPEITYFKIHDPPVPMSSPDAEVIVSTSDFSSKGRDDGKWKEDFIVKPADTHNLQRPETVESLFYMWRITGDVVYREWGWEIFEAFVRHTAVEGGPEGVEGFSSIQNVNAAEGESVGWRDNMESFWPVNLPPFPSHPFLSLFLLLVLLAIA